MNQLVKHIAPWFLALMVMSSSCNVGKYVPSGDKLFAGSRIRMKQGKEKAGVMDALQALARPKPNNSLFGIKYQLLIFNLFKEPKSNKSLVYTIKHKWGEPPALLSQANPASSARRMENYYFSAGHFRTTVSYSVDDSGKEARIHYLVDKGPQYYYGKISLPVDTGHVSAMIRESFDSTLLKEGAPFSLDELSRERERIDAHLKRRGYYFFNPEFLLFRVDSTTHPGNADLYLTVKEETPDLALRPWTIGNIRVYGNYRSERDSAIRAQAGIRGNRFYYIDKNETYRRSVFEKAVTLREGQLYNKDAHSLTIERLMNLNNFHFVRLHFDPVDTFAHQLDGNVFVTPQNKRSLRFEVSGNSKSNNFFGTELGLTYKNINLFRGAEILEVKLNAGMDIQSGGNSESNAYLFNATANLYVPKLFVPKFIKVRTKKSPYIPRTIISPGIEYNRTPDLYTLRSIHASFGYYWKYGVSSEHTLRLLNVSVIQPTRTTAKFDSLVATDPALRAATEEQLVVGMRYEYSFNNTYKTWKRFNHAFYFYTSSSGNLVNLLIRPHGDTAGSRKIGGLPVSQYFKAQGDLRGYYKLNKNAIVAGRLVLGGAWAYKNSIAVPYFEQFVTGGSSSIRAFRLRTLGPGSYHTTGSDYDATESGEFKLETNAEFRYKLTNRIGLASFLDAGNIWLWKEDKTKPGSGLEAGDLFNEMAVGGGLGIRFDITIMVLRFDLGIPLRKPWYPAGQRWVFNQMDFGSPSWRKENLVLNIAIGYPF